MLGLTLPLGIFNVVELRGVRANAKITDVEIPV